MKSGIKPKAHLDLAPFLLRLQTGVAKANLRLSGPLNLLKKYWYDAD